MRLKNAKSVILTVGRLMLPHSNDQIRVGWVLLTKSRHCVVWTITTFHFLYLVLHSDRPIINVPPYNYTRPLPQPQDQIPTCSGLPLTHENSSHVLPSRLYAPFISKFAIKIYEKNWIFMYKRPHDQEESIYLQERCNSFVQIIILTYSYVPIIRFLSIK